MKFVETAKLRPGMRLAKPIYNRMGVMLYERDTTLTMAGIKSIENFGLIGIFILEPAEPLPPISKEDMQFEQFQTIFMFRIKAIFEKLQDKKEPDGLVDLANSILSRYGNLDHKMNFTQNIRSSVDFVYKHAVSSSILAALISNRMNLSKQEKTNLVVSALLYDFGYLFVPRRILEKGSELSMDDYHIINECRHKGFDLLYPDINAYNLPHEVFTIIQQVHNCLSLSPEEDIEPKSLSKGASILLVADRFDQLTAMNLSTTPVSEVTAIRTLSEFPNHYSMEVISALADCIHILPTGCSIDLSNSDKGIVLTENDHNFMAPIILSIKDNQIYDLSDPKVADQLQIVDVMKTMDNRIVIDSDTLKCFSSDPKLQRTLEKFRRNKAASSPKAVSIRSL